MIDLALLYVRLWKLNFAMAASDSLGKDSVFL